MDELTPDVVSTRSGITEAQTEKLAIGAKGVVESFQDLQVFALRWSSQNCEQVT